MELIQTTKKLTVVGIALVGVSGCVSWNKDGTTSTSTSEPVVIETAEPVVEEPKNEEIVAPAALPAIPAAPQIKGGVVELVAAADAAAAKGDHEVSATYIERALRIAPENATLWLKLSQARSAQGLHRVSETFALKAVSFSALHERSVKAQAWDVIANARTARQDHTGAAEAAEAAAYNR